MRRLVTRIGVALAVTAPIVMGASVVAAPTASAAGCTPSNCLRLYQNAGFAGLMGQENTVGWWNIRVIYNDQMSSAGNATPYYAVFYTNSNRTGSCWRLNPNTGKPDYGFTGYNDTMSSFELRTTPGSCPVV